jgi:hypothetical protein
MKILWIAGLLAIFLISSISPEYYNVTTDSALPSDVSSGILTHVYGMDYSDEIYNNVSQTRYRNFVQKITENGSRWIMDYTMAERGANMYARNYIIQQFQELSNGRIETEVIGNHLNVVGKLPGYLPGSNPAFAITAHYDSVDRSPGANCDGSGIATVLELVKVMSQYEWPLDIYFIAFNGLFTQNWRDGSPEVVTEFIMRGIELLTLYNVDTILVQNPVLPINERIQFGYEGAQYHKGRYWAELARQMSNNLGQNLILPVPSTSFYLWTLSDHYSFSERGYGNPICAFESGLSLDDSYHSSNDRWDNPDYNYNIGRETTAVIGASIAFTMSRAIGEPTKTNFELYVRGGNFNQIHFAITTPTLVNISSRWYGGTSSFYLLDPENNVIASQEYNYTSAWELSNVISYSASEQGLYTLVVYNSDYHIVGYDVEISINTDIDANGILDSQEYWIDQALFNSDQDGDGISDAEEILFGTDMMLVDSDGDAMPDKYELDHGFDPRNPSDGGEDADQDGLSNAQEFSGGLNPLSEDSDSDSIPDLWELENGLNPLLDDADLDLDGDGISNLDEYLNGTDPQSPEIMEIPQVWYFTPAIIIALIGAFVYIRKRGDPWD